MGSFRARAWLLVGFVGVSSACSSTSGSATGGASADAGADAPKTEHYDAKGCVVPSDGIPAGAACVRSVKVRVVDDAGKPVADLVTTACGDGCTFGKTDANGVAVMDAHLYMRKAGLMLHGKSKYATYVVTVRGEGDIDAGTLALPLLPADGAALPASKSQGTATYGDVTFAFAAGAALDVDTLELPDADQQKFRALAVDPALKIAALWALAPFDTKIDPGASVTLANRANLPAGSAVEIFIQGTDIGDKYGPYAGFSKAAEGHVSADGKTITTDPGQLVGEITWIGVRAKP
jgi:hypothetical protein